MSQSSVRAQSFTDTDALLKGVAYWGGSVRGATSSAVFIRRGTALGLIIDEFLPADATTENHSLTAPVGAPEGVFVDVVVTAGSSAVWFE